MRKFLQRLLTKPIIRLSDKYSSRPDRKRVDAALSELHREITGHPGDRGLLINFNAQKQKFVILSDQHKGARDGADDFALAEKNYLAALDYYHRQNFFYINLGDSEELWENMFATVKKHNKATFKAEQQFLKRDAFVKIFGNHDLYWDNDPLAPISLKQIYGKEVKIYEGIILQTEVNQKTLSIYMTHGHQGDLQSDGNWFSKWFISDIWGPVQAYLRINPNTPANNNELKTAHNQMMYQWSAKQENVLLITGHTHQPVFKSLTHIEQLYMDLDQAKSAGDQKTEDSLNQQIKDLHLKGETRINLKNYKPTYFNSGCCCFDDGDITGIELEDEMIRLIKWDYKNRQTPERIILAESKLADLLIN